jgi:signal transduction histidine kinase
VTRLVVHDAPEHPPSPSGIYRDLSALLLGGASADALLSAALCQIGREMHGGLVALRWTTDRGEAKVVSLGDRSGVFGPVLFASLPTTGSSAVLAVCRRVDAPSFGVADESRLAAVAAYLAATLDGYTRRTADIRLSREEDRRRIAEDLHDSAIQEIFAAGLLLAGVVETSDQDTAGRVTDAINALDRATKALRLAVFNLAPAPDNSTDYLSERIRRLTGDASRSLGFEPDVLLGGPVDGALSASVATHLVLVLRECLANIARHARATKVSIDVTVGATDVTATVRDNGVGFADTGLGNGVRNMQHRAQRLGGECSIGPARGGGTLVRWRVPLSSSATQ